MNKTFKNIDKRLKKLEVTPLQKIFYAISISCGIMLIIAYISSIIGNDYFLIKANIEITNPFLLYAIPTCLFMLNMVFVFAVSLEIKGKHLAKITFMYLPIYIFSMVFIGNNLISTLIIPIIYILIISTYILKTKRTIFNLFCFTLGLALFQFILSIIKTGNFYYTNSHITFSAVHYLTIDLIIIYGLTIMIKGAIKYGVSMGNKLFIFSKEINKNTDDIEDIKAEQKLNSLIGKDKILAIVIMFSFQILQLFFVMIVCKIGNVLIECIVILPMFWLMRSILKRCWHSKSLVWCTIISALIFYTGAKFSIPLKYSLFCPIIVGSLIAYILYRVALYTDEYKEQQELILELKEHSKQLLTLKHIRLSKGMSKEPLKNACDVKKMSEQEYEMLKWKYVDCLPMTDIISKMDYKYGISRATVFRHLDIAEQKFQSII